MPHLKVTVTAIDALLPQTQCGDCGYKGCKPYAEAILGGEKINKCLPGGLPVLKALGELLEENINLLAEELRPKEKIKTVALIRPNECIGCTKCIQACPVDAIIGAAKQMHTVLITECTGCHLCVEPCPMDCIDMVPTHDQTYYRDYAKTRYENHMKRIKQKPIQNHGSATQAIENNKTKYISKKEAIAAAIARVKNKKKI